MCDFEKSRLATALNALGLNARPAHLDDGSQGDGDNECLRITHEDKSVETAVKDQKYEADGKQYTVSILSVGVECTLKLCRLT